MNCRDLAERIQQMRPDAPPRDVARLCLLLTNYIDDLDDLDDDQQLARAWRAMSIRLQAATDQHAAMTEELEDLAQLDPAKFTLQEVWVLIRAIKVQSRILRMYVGQPPVEVSERPEA